MEFLLSDLKIATTWTTDIKFTLLNNCKFGEVKEINQNALGVSKLTANTICSPPTSSACLIK